MNIADLKKPFPVDKVSFRVGSTNQKAVARQTGNERAVPTKGIGLAYIDARDVMERLDEVCGPQNWQALYPHANGKTSCKIGINVTAGMVSVNQDGVRNVEQWVWKENGAGDTDVEGEKGAFSDAFKRAAVLWGIGRYLYDMPNTWVDLDETGRKFTPGAMKQLQKALAELSAGKQPVINTRDNVRLVSEINQLLTPAAAKAWWKDNEAAILSLPQEQQEEVDEQFQSRLKQCEDGDATPGTFKWGSVGEGRAWVKDDFQPKLAACQSLIAISNLVAANNMRIEALTGMANGVSDKQRLKDQIEEKRATFNVTEAG